MSNQNKDHYIAIYEQYWQHARHVEHESHLFTSVYAIIIGAIFAATASGIGLEIKIWMAIFGAILSLFGYVIVCELRIPFVIFVVMSEIIAIKEFEMKYEYRRFIKDDKVFPGNKPIDTPDLLACFYSFIAGVMVYLFTYPYVTQFRASILGTILILILVIIQFRLIRPYYIRRANELVKESKVKKAKTS